MGYIFQPFQSIGEIVFNMTRKQVRQTLKGKVKEFLKTPQSKRMTDAFGDLGLKLLVFMCITTIKNSVKQLSCLTLLK